jgi:hypothetical protein
MRESRPGRTYRGSTKRIRRIGWRHSGSLELVLLVGWIVFLLLVVIPWIANHWD